MDEQPKHEDQHDTEPRDKLVDLTLVDDEDDDDDHDDYAGDPSADGTIVREHFAHCQIVDTTRKRIFGAGRRPAKIGRYRVIRCLGAGGMGEVYLARDEDLDRKVAVKRMLGCSGSARDHERLRREARALARLSHPNVVQVYEFGEHDGRTFVAMEYVEGRTLGNWLSRGQRSWRTVIEIFLAAGRGLAAAHEAGLVHRDFKPDNVLLSSDGRVLVADFGLALAGEQQRPERGRIERLSPDTRMSVTGAVLGTVRYMPLEQLTGRAVDERSDQFSFCVALYEALWGKPPFSIDDRVVYLDALEASEPEVPKSGTGARVPPRLWRVVRRGLSRDPSARWPDMQALLAALEGVGRRRRRLAWLGSAAAALSLSVGAVLLTQPEPPEPCAAVERELDGTWDEALRSELESSLGRLEAGHVADSLARVVGGLDRWALGWTDEREQLCRATSEQRVEPELGRLHATCLTRQRQRVEDLVALLLEPQTSGDELARAVEAVTELPPAAACQNELALLGVEPPGEGIRAEVEAIRRELARAHELRLLGRVEAGLEMAEQAEEAARALGYGPLHAEALAELAKGEFVGGSIEQAAERMQEAIDAAELNHHDYLAADLWTELTLRQLIDLGDAEEGARSLRRAVVNNGRTEASTRAEARLAFARGQLAEQQGDDREAEQGYREAIAIADGDQASAADRAGYLSSLANVVCRRESSEGVMLHRKAVEDAEKHYGPRHPFTATLVYELALAIRHLDSQDPEIDDLLTRAVEIWYESHARPSHNLARAEMLLGMLALQRLELDEAETHAHKLASIQDSIYPERHADRAYPAQLMAAVHGIRGEHEQALVQLRAALDIVEPVDGLRAPNVQRLHSDVAASLLALGMIDEAADELDTLLPHVDGKPEQVSVRLRRSEVALRRGQLDRAATEIDAIDALELDNLGGHEYSYALLRALIELRRGQLKLPTLTALHESRATTPFSAEQIGAWLDQIGLSAAERATLDSD